MEDREAKRRGRPTKRNQSVMDQILRALRAGATRTAAAESAGISYEAFRLWTLNFLDFFASVTRAEADAEVFFSAVIASAARGTQDNPPDWRAALEWLKRRRRAEWGDQIDIRKLDDTTIVRLLSVEERSEPARDTDFDPARLAEE